MTEHNEMDKMITPVIEPAGAPLCQFPGENGNQEKPDIKCVDWRRHLMDRFRRVY